MSDVEKYKVSFKTPNFKIMEMSDGLFAIFDRPMGIVTLVCLEDIDSMIGQGVARARAGFQLSATDKNFLECGFGLDKIGEKHFPFSPGQIESLGSEKATRKVIELAQKTMGRDTN